MFLFLSRVTQKERHQNIFYQPQNVMSLDDELYCHNKQYCWNNIFQDKRSERMKNKLFSFSKQDTESSKLIFLFPVTFCDKFNKETKHKKVFFIQWHNCWNLKWIWYEIPFDTIRLIEGRKRFGISTWCRVKFLNKKGELLKICHFFAMKLLLTIQSWGWKVFD